MQILVSVTEQTIYIEEIRMGDVELRNAWAKYNSGGGIWKISLSDSFSVST